MTVNKTYSNAYLLINSVLILGCVALGFLFFFGPYWLWLAGMYVSRNAAYISWGAGALVLFLCVGGQLIRARHNHISALTSSAVAFILGVLLFSSVIDPRIPTERVLTSPLRVASGDPSLNIFFFGDMGKNNRRANVLAAMLLEENRKQPIDGIFLLGDTLQEKHPDFDSLFGNVFLGLYQPLLDEGVRFYSLLGNHEYNDGVDIDRFVNQPEHNMGGWNYYKRVFGDGLMTVLVLDSETIVKDPVQMLWLEEMLRQCTSRWTVVAFHKPLTYVEEAHGLRVTITRQLEALLKRHGKVNLILTGHIHYYERFTTPNAKIMSVIAGGTSVVNDEMKAPKPNSEIQFNKQSSVGRLIVTNEILTIEGVAADGTIFDKVTIVAR